MSTSRDDFHKPTKDTLAKRVAFKCSNPDCMKPTVGPHSSKEKSTTVGVAAHITAASLGGPRYDSNLNEEQRRGIENGIWLCALCATIIDKDENSYKELLLRDWKQKAESKALQELKGINSHDTKRSNRPIIEMDLIYSSSSRTPLSYADENFVGGQTSFQVGHPFIQFWDLNWRHRVQLMNNSSTPAINVKIEQILGEVAPKILALEKLNNIQPFKEGATKMEFLSKFKGTHIEADKLICNTIPTNFDDLKFRIIYLNESREEFETIVSFKDGEIENFIDLK